MKKIFTIIIAILIFSILLVGCTSAGPSLDGSVPSTGIAPDDSSNSLSSMYDPTYEGTGGNQFNEIIENPFVSVEDSLTSALRLSTSTSSYSYTRLAINSGYLPESDAVRIEEYINYFDYDVAQSTTGIFNTYSSIYQSPWNEDNLLMRFTLQANDIDTADIASNLVFLIDVSGSMYGSDRLGLVQTAFSYLAQGLGEQDRVSIVTYAGSSEIVLSGESGANTQALLSAMDGLTANGGTNGSGALETAYNLAYENKIEGGNNRIILATDGDFNIGTTSSDGLIEQISSYSDMGIYLSCVGVGNGNYNDSTMENLAKYGNGQAYYLDSESEAKRVFAEELTGTIYTLAEQAKAQITFNSELVSEYRLIGYDNLLLTTEEYEDEDTDAGEVGAGQTVTIVYEIVPKVYDSDEAYATVEVKYVDVATGIEETLNCDIVIGDTNADDEFIGCLIECAMLFRDSEYKMNASLENVIARLEQLELTDEYKLEFLELAKKSQYLEMII